MDNINQKEVSQKSTKKAIWEAYQAVLHGVAQKEKSDENQHSMVGSLYSEEEKIVEQVNMVTVEKAMGDIGQLKISMASALNNFGDKISEELKKLEAVNKAIALKNERLKNLYNIESEAVSLFGLIEAKEKERASLETSFQKEKERLEQEIVYAKKQHEREENEYQYQLKITRQQEQDEQDFKNKVKERDFNEKLTVKQKELSVREAKITEQEGEIKEMKSRFEKFPDEIEKVKSQSYVLAQKELESWFENQKDLLEKDHSKEVEIAKLKNSSLEDIIKKQQTQINNLESQLSLALAKAQELAVKIIEFGKQNKESEKVTDNTKANNN